MALMRGVWFDQGGGTDCIASYKMKDVLLLVASSAGWNVRVAKDLRLPCFYVVVEKVPTILRRLEVAVHDDAKIDLLQFSPKAGYFDLIRQSFGDRIRLSVNLHVRPRCGGKSWHMLEATK